MSNDDDRRLFLDYLAGKPIRKGLQKKKPHESTHSLEDEFAAYLERHGVPERYNTPEREQERQSRITRSERNNPSIRDSIDLHGHTAKQAEAAIRTFITNAYEKGMSPVRVVHGKGLHSGGKGVVRNVVETYLAHEGASMIREVHTAPGKHGGSGAKIVWLRRKR